MADLAGRGEILVDANVLIDIATDDPRWGGWSARALAEAGRGRGLVLSPIVYAEVSVAYERIEEVDTFLPVALFRREDPPWEAAFLAGKAHLAYRKRGGARATPMPDFFIGAHAAVRDYALLTRDRTRFETYFPRLHVIAPGGEAEA